MLPSDLHPDCLHPISNMSDDYAGVECCVCSGSPCPAVTPVLALAHDTFLSWITGEAS